MSKVEKKMYKGLLHMWCVTFLMVSFFRFQNMQALRRIPRFWLSLSIGFLMLSKDLDSSISLWFSYFLTCNELLVLTRKKQQLSTLHVKTLHNYVSRESICFSSCHVLCEIVILLARYVIEAWNVTSFVAENGAWFLASKKKYSMHKVTFIYQMKQVTLHVHVK